MPQGMLLKSEGFASSLYDPGSIFTLRRYCEENRLPYADIGSPVPLETFVVSQFPPSDVLVVRFQLRLPVPPFRTWMNWLLSVVLPVFSQKLIWPGRLSKNGVEVEVTVKVTEMMKETAPPYSVTTICPG